MRRFFLCLVLLSTALSAAAQSITTVPVTTPSSTTTTADRCDPDDTTKPCTVAGAYEFFLHPAVVTGAQNQVKEDVTNTNKATTPPDEFARRLHNSYQDYLNLLSFAINDVKESSDGKAVVVRFNPLREGHHLLGFTLTASKPQLATSVSDAIPETIRTSTVTTLQKQLSDTDDLTWSASYSLATVKCPANWSDDASRCYGRTPKAYREIVSALLSDIPVGVDPGKEIKFARELIGFYPGSSSPFAERVDAANNVPALKAKLRELAALDQAARRQLKAFYESHHLDIVPTLIDNQPQVSGTASVRSPGRLGGAQSSTATIEVHFGRNNMNSLRKSCQAFTTEKAIGTCLKQQLDLMADGGLLTDKIVLTAAYNRSNKYDVAMLTTDGTTPVVGFMPVSLPKTSELNVKVQGGRQLGGMVTDQPIHADLSIEGIRSIEGTHRKENRWVGALTLSIPLGKSITIPVTIQYANKREFLTDKNAGIGAHLGISYRLPALFSGGV